MRPFLAAFVVVGGGAFLVALWFSQATRAPDAFTSAVVAMMSGVLGYYFGSRGIERAQDQLRAEGALRELAEATAGDLGSLAPSDAAEIRALRERVAEWKRFADEARQDPDLARKLDDLLSRVRGEGR